MAKRSLMVVGLDLPWKAAEYVPIRSKRSLLDGDIIVVHPVLSEFPTNDTYLGRPSYDDDDSFTIWECISHWKNQITAALTAGKTVIVFLVEQDTFYLATGQKQHSGTGRNQKTTRIVQPQTNYSLLPVTLKDLRNATGSKIKGEPKIWPLSRYWEIMESISQYCVTYQVESATPLLKTPDGSQVVASFSNQEGCLALVPDFIYPDTEFQTEEDEWNDEGRNFAARLEAAFLSLDTELREASVITEMPDWVRADRHRLEAESQIEGQIRGISNQLSTLQKEHGLKIEELRSYASIKGLLYEKGHALADAVINALRELGFSADRYDDGKSEFDVVFSADGFRYLGEVEGKDEKAINVDKSSQLERNIQEDFERDEVADYAIGVLFGNASRLKDIDSRKDFFTEKVLKAAERTGIRLIRTPDLFAAIQEFRRTNDRGFAAACRQALQDQAGQVVRFPLPDAPAKADVATLDNPVK